MGLLQSMITSVGFACSSTLHWGCVLQGTRQWHKNIVIFLQMPDFFKIYLDVSDIVALNYFNFYD
jgi:hypothetical protein